MDKKYYVIDLSTKPLGRVATKIADLLRGKNDPNFAPNIVPENYVIAINAKGVNLTATKEESKVYYNYSGFHGGLKEYKFKDLKKNKPSEIVIRAVKGMLPKNKLQDEFLKHLVISVDNNHKFANEKLIEVKE